MNKSFYKIFGIAFVLSLIMLAGIEWSFKQTIKFEHMIGWTFVAIFIGALLGITFSKKGNSH